MSVFRSDLGTLRPVERLPDGRVRVDALLTRSGIFRYTADDGSERLELRPDDEVFRPQSMRSFAVVPLTDDHPPEMLTARTAKQFAVGSTGDTIVRDDNHVRGSIGVFDADTIAKMDAGKLEISCGYTCDLEDAPGVHPVYGPYHAIQRNIVGNHVALVDQGRAGSARVRMDGVFVNPRKADSVARSGTRGTLRAMAQSQPAARIDVVVRHDVGGAVPTSDPDDLASRNARDPNRDDDDDEPEMDFAPSAPSMYDSDGKLTEAASARIAASSFAVPGRQKLPIHDPSAVKDSMRNFGAQEFDGADEKHAAFNRIVSRAGQFGVSASKFTRAHSGTLDRKDQDMIDAETKARADKADKYKTQRNEARERADKADVANAALQGKLDSALKDLEAERAKVAPRADAADKAHAAEVAAKVDLVVKATKILGVGKVDAATPDGDIKRAVIKHIDKVDVPADKHPAYVDAMFDGAVARATADAAATAAGAAAIAGARGVVTPAPLAEDKPAPRVDAAAEEGLDDEDAARKRAAARRDSMARNNTNSRGMTKAQAMTFGGK